MIDRATLSEADAFVLDERRDYVARRRARNRAAGRCINDNSRGTHGPATHGIRCERCAAVHAGKPVSAA